MRKVILKDGTIITNCTDATTSNEVHALRDNYEDAGAVRDLFTEENATRIEVKDENDVTTTVGADLILLGDTDFREVAEGIECIIKTRTKTELEMIHDEIAELQEIIIEE